MVKIMGYSDEFIRKNQFHAHPDRQDLLSSMKIWRLTGHLRFWASIVLLWQQSRFTNWCWIL